MDERNAAVYRQAEADDAADAAFGITEPVRRVVEFADDEAF